ncbi:hypothetical protein ABPG77_006043 [Micractinium sp. CCAP 211/92]
MAPGSPLSASAGFVLFLCSADLHCLSCVSGLQSGVHVLEFLPTAVCRYPPATAGHKGAWPANWLALPGQAPKAEWQAACTAAPLQRRGRAACGRARRGVFA